MSVTFSKQVVQSFYPTNYPTKTSPTSISNTSTVKITEAELSAETKLPTEIYGSFGKQDNVQLNVQLPKILDYQSWIEGIPEKYASAEKKERMSAVLGRLSETQQISLIKSGVATDDNFLTLASKLDEQDLSALIVTINAMGVSAQSNYTSSVKGLNNNDKLTRFMEVLANSDQPAQDKLLVQAYDYAQKVNLNERHSIQAYYSNLSETTLVKNNDHEEAPSLNIYLSQPDQFNIKISNTANDLQNFVSATIQSDNSAEFIDKFDQFNQSQQTNLLNTFGWEHELGERLMDSMLNKSDDVRSKMLSFTGNLVDKANGANYTKLDFVYSPPSSEFNGDMTTKSAIDNIKNNGRDNINDMLENTLALVENYQFSDEQMISMADDLSSLKRSEQMSYLEITHLGLKHLLNDDPKITDIKDMSAHQDEMHAIELLRQDPATLEAVYQTHFNGKVDPENEELYYVKSDASYQKDVSNMVEVLSSYAFSYQQSNAKMHTSPSELAQQFDTMDAKQRDKLTQSLHDDLQKNRPLNASFSKQETI